MTDIKLIGGVRSDAAQWRGAPAETLTQIVQHMIDASDKMHKGVLNGAALECIRKAAAMINDHGLGIYAIKCLYRHRQQYFTVEVLTDCALDDARYRAGSAHIDIRGVRYPSRSAAAAALNVAVPTITKAVARGTLHRVGLQKRAQHAKA